MDEGRGDMFAMPKQGQTMTTPNAERIEARVESGMIRFRNMVKSIAEATAELVGTDEYDREVDRLKDFQAILSDYAALQAELTYAKEVAEGAGYRLAKAEAENERLWSEVMASQRLTRTVEKQTARVIDERDELKAENKRLNHKLTSAENELSNTKDRARKWKAELDAARKRMEDFANGVRQMLYDIADKPRGTGA